MNTFNVAEKFVSINGEGLRAGELAVFIRFCGCNLNCSYCDTRWANENSVIVTPMTADEIYAYIKSTEIKNVTLTGGEPLIQPGIEELLDILGSDRDLHVEIETNGSIPIKKFKADNFTFTIDCKLPSSGMYGSFDISNIHQTASKDTLKFVVGDNDDLKIAADMVLSYNLVSRINVFISPVFGEIDPAEIVEFMKTNKLNGVKLQLQLHKLIWNPETRGV
ncbi:MAG: putative 7-carboxy-7-deazaguanine synthase QueE [Ruminococcus sp.]|nr:putative 7-carboxy-7-deazaguanine synthase QueE [Ruminococcus sp.]